jgi:DNA uptake protein ComE-like DNA-binding protein
MAAPEATARSSRRVGLRDWWLLLPLISFGVFSWAALFYVGLRAHNRRWLVWAGIYLAPIFIAFGIDAAAGGADWSGTLAGFILFTLMIGGFAHGMAVRGAFYDVLAGGAEDDYDNAQRRLSAREQGRKLAGDDPAKARQLGVGRPDLPDSFDASLVDLNSAPAKVIARIAGVSSSVADRGVEMRTATGAFSSVEDLDLLVDLDPADVTKLKDAGVCVPLT